MLLLYFTAYFKNIQDPGSQNDLLYQIYPKPSSFNHTCRYFVHENTTMISQLVATQLGRLSEWSIGNGITWCLAAAALLVAFRPPLCGMVHAQQRFKPWYFIVSVGSVILGLTGEYTLVLLSL